MIDSTPGAACVQLSWEILSGGNIGHLWGCGDIRPRGPFRYLKDCHIEERYTIFFLLLPRAKPMGESDRKILLVISLSWGRVRLPSEVGHCPFMEELSIWGG